MKPALIGATKIAHIILRPSAEDLLAESSGQAFLNEELKQIGLELTEIELMHNSTLDGQQIGDVEVGGGFVIVAVKRKEGSVVRKPAADLKLATGDVIMILGHSESLPQLVRRAKSKQTVSFRGATT